jgi:hypothetical protein
VSTTSADAAERARGVKERARTRFHSDASHARRCGATQRTCRNPHAERQYGFPAVDARRRRIAPSVRQRFLVERFRVRESPRDRQARDVGVVAELQGNTATHRSIAPQPLIARRGRGCSRRSQKCAATLAPSRLMEVTTVESHCARGGAKPSTPLRAERLDGSLSCTRPSVFGRRRTERIHQPDGDASSWASPNRPGRPTRMIERTLIAVRRWCCRCSSGDWRRQRRRAGRPSDSQQQLPASSPRSSRAAERGCSPAVLPTTRVPKSRG